MRPLDACKLTRTNVNFLVHLSKKFFPGINEQQSNIHLNLMESCLLHANASRGQARRHLTEDLLVVSGYRPTLGRNPLHSVAL